MGVPPMSITGVPSLKVAPSLPGPKGVLEGERSRGGVPMTHGQDAHATMVLRARYKRAVLQKLVGSAAPRRYNAGIIPRNIKPQILAALQDAWLPL